MPLQIAVRFYDENGGGTREVCAAGLESPDTPDEDTVDAVLARETTHTFEFSVSAYEHEYLDEFKDEPDQASLFHAKLGFSTPDDRDEAFAYLKNVIPKSWGWRFFASRQRTLVTKLVLELGAERSWLIRL